MKNRKIYEAVNFIMTALLVFPIVLLLERTLNPNSEWYSLTIKTYPIMFCFIAGRLSRRYSLYITSLFLFTSCVLAVFLIYMISDNGSIFIWTCFFPAFLIFFIASKTDDIFPFSLTVAGIIIYLAGIIVFAVSFGLSDITVVNYTALLYFILSLLIFNSQGLNSAAQNNGLTHIHFPAGLFRNNSLLLIVFIIISFLTASIKPLKSLLAIPFRILFFILGFISDLFNTEDIPSEQSNFDFSMPELDTSHNESQLSQSIFYIIAFLVCLFAILLLIRIVFKSFNNFNIKFPSIFKWLRAKKTENKTEEYEDNIESLFDWENIRSRLKLFFKRNRPVRQKMNFNDMQSNREKVRFAFKFLLRNRIKTSSNILSKTPIELYSDDEINLQKLAADYNIARYSEREVSDEAAINAGKVIKG